MTRVEAAAWAVMDAAPATVYSVIADYRGAHRKILPTRYFSNLEVERGGFGAGTLIQFTMRAFGGRKTYLAEVSEPIPGRMLVETNLDQQNATTTFTVLPVGDGSRTSVTIRTQWMSSGLRGFIEKYIAPRVLKKIYQEELDNLAAVALETEDSREAIRAAEKEPGKRGKTARFESVEQLRPLRGRTLQAL